MRLTTKSLRRFLPTGALLAVGILLSVTIFLAVRKFEDQDVKATFHNAALQSLDALETQITLTLNSLASLGHFMTPRTRWNGGNSPASQPIAWHGTMRSRRSNGFLRCRERFADAMKLLPVKSVLRRFRSPSEFGG